MVLDVEVYPKMLGKKSKAVPEGNGLIPQDAYVMFGGIKLKELRPIMSKTLDKAFDKSTEMMKRANKRLAGPEQEAQQSRLATEADVTSEKKTRERPEGAAAAVQAKHGVRCSAKRVQAGPTSSTSTGMKAEPPALPPRDSVLVNIGAAAPKPCLSPVEMPTLTVTDSLLPTGKTSTATTTIFHQLPFWFCLIKEVTSRISQYATDYSSFWKLKVLDTIEANSGFRSRRLYRSPTRLSVLGSVAHVSLKEGFSSGRRMVPKAAALFGKWMTRSRHLAGEAQTNHLRRAYCGRSLFLCNQVGLNMSCRQRRHAAM